MKETPKTSVKLPGEIDFAKKEKPKAEAEEKKAAAPKAAPKASASKAASKTASKTAPKAAAKASDKKATAAPVAAASKVPKACPFVKAASTRRLKAFFWGPTGSGKTTLAMGFPDPAMIDADGGAELYAEAAGIYRYAVSAWDDAVSAVDWLLQNTHEFKTLIVDPVTKLWEMLQWKWNGIFLKRNKGGAGHKFDYYKMQIADWNPMKAEWKQFIQKLLALDMNIIVTAREKDLFADDGSIKKVGLTFDGEKNLPYEFDLNLRLMVNEEDGKHYARVAGDKDRTRNLPWVKKNPLPLGKSFVISYEVLRKHLGADWLEKASGDVEYFASKADQKKIGKAFKDFGLTQGQVNTWLAKHDADSISELTKEAAQKVFAEVKIGKAKLAAKAAKK